MPLIKMADKLQSADKAKIKDKLQQGELIVLSRVYHC